MLSEGLLAPFMMFEEAERHILVRFQWKMRLCEVQYELPANSVQIVTSFSMNYLSIQHKFQTTR